MATNAKTRDPINHVVNGTVNGVVSDDDVVKKKHAKDDTDDKLKAQKSNLVDLIEIITNWAKETYSLKHPKENIEECTFDVNPKSLITTTLKTEHTTVAKSTKPKEQTIFKSTFCNKTEEKQDHTFKTQRDTTSTYTTTVTDGYTSKFNLGINVNVPCVGSVTTGFGQDVTMTTADTETHSKHMAWFVDTMIHVPPYTKTTATVDIEENTCDSTFTILVKITGNVEVTITDSKGKTSSVSQDIATVLDTQNDPNKNKKFSDLNEKRVVAILPDTNKVIWKLRGESVLQYGVEQTVFLEQEKILLNSKETQTS